MLKRRVGHNKELTLKEQSLEASLERLRAYRARDPQFLQARKAFLEAEASVDDPLEGDPIEGHFVSGQVEPIGPAQIQKHSVKVGIEL